jgi:Uma2 family endonuclease
VLHADVSQVSRQENAMATHANVRDERLSVDEFMDLPEEEGYRLELDRGRLVREPGPGPRHGRVAFRVVDLLRREGEEKGRGLVFFDTAFTLTSDPPTVRVPDVAFVTSGRIPEEGITDRFWELTPDLVVEVVSPSNRASDMQQKAVDYLDTGARSVWVVDPARRTVAVYRSRAEIRILVEGEILDGGDVLPDLEAPVATLFR